MFKKVFIAGLLLVGFFDLNPKKIWDIVDDVVVPTPTIEVEEPTQELKDFTKDFADSITNKADKIEIAVLANEFSKRLSGEVYSRIQFQTLNDVYVESSKLFYSKKMSEDYPKFASDMQNLLSTAAGGDDNISLSDSELKSISDYLKAFAWNLSR